MGGAGGLATGWSGLGQHENPAGTPSWIVDGDHYGYVGDGSGVTNGEMYQDVAANPGDSIELTYYAAMHNIAQDSGSVEIQYLDSGKSPLGSAAVNTSLYGFDSNWPTTSMGPQQTLTLGAAPTNTAYVRVKATYVNNSGSWDATKLDDMCLYRTAAPTPKGNLTITKTVTGGADPQSFQLQLDCTDNSFDDANITLADGQTHTVNDIPAGTQCTVTESAPTAPTGYTYDPAVIIPAQPVTITDGVTASVSVTNPLKAAAIPTADLEVTKVAGKSKVKSGDVVRYTITVTNHGPDAATNVELKDQLPAGVTYKPTHTATQGSYDLATGIWAVGNLAKDATATLTIDVSVD
jgi:uncharacterized repeat protein (TIGR01451 family)